MRILTEGMKLTQKQITTFRRTIRDHYRRYGRHHLPWRRTTSPYRILVSEIMLQQTQVERVIPKYRAFLRRFPSMRSLARASLTDVLQVWQGLGYNRRAVALRKTASLLVREHNGRLPHTVEELVRLPGIGDATASALCAFAFNHRVLFIETNIRTVFIHFFLHSRRSVSDTQIGRLLKQTADRKNPREWYYALMDYGAFLKRNNIKLNDRIIGYAKQSRFEGSRRQVRGAVIRYLAGTGESTKSNLVKKIDMNGHDPDSILESLERDGLVRRYGKNYRIG
jgi:A/G-specific adenine glycosylase